MALVAGAVYPPGLAGCVSGGGTWPVTPKPRLGSREQANVFFSEKWGIGSMFAIVGVPRVTH